MHFEIGRRSVFALKTEDLTCDGFDSQNTSHSFPSYPNWNPWVWGIFRIGLRGWSVDTCLTPHQPLKIVNQTMK